MTNAKGYEDDRLFEALDRMALERWESGEMMTRDEWESEYEDIRESYLDDYLTDNYDIDPDVVECVNLPFWTLGELADASMKEVMDCTDTILGEFDGTDRRLDGMLLDKLIGDVRNLVRSLPDLAEAALGGDWDRFVDLVHMRHELIHHAFLHFYGAMPEQYRRDFVVGCYESHGDHDWMCRTALKNLPRNGTDELPEGYRDQDEITVWRAGEEPIEEAASRISWSLSEDVARFFLDKYAGSHAEFLYRAHIRPRDVIGYNDDRNEKEVMQYMSVYDVELVDTKHDESE